MLDLDSPAVRIFLQMWLRLHCVLLAEGAGTFGTDPTAPEIPIKHAILLVTDLAEGP
jgi:hypothetical protein